MPCNVTQMCSLQSNHILSCTCRSPLCGLTVFRQAYNNFVAGLAGDWVFKCPICKDTPPVVCCDATMLCMLKDHYHGVPITEPAKGEVWQVCDPGHNRASRSFANATTTHVPLERLSVFVRGISPGQATWINPRTHTSYDLPANYNFYEDLESSNIKQLPTMSLKEKRKAEARTTVSASDDEEARAATVLGDHLCLAFCSLGLLAACDLSSVDPDAMGILARFISCLASSSPVASYLPFAAASSMTSAIQGNRAYLSPVEDECVGKYAPIVHKALIVLKDQQFLPFSLQLPHWHALFSRLCEISTLCVTVSPTLRRGVSTGMPNLPEPDENMESQPSCKGAECLSHGTICGLQRVRGRVPCAADKNKGKDAMCRDADVPRSKQCNHGFYAAGKKTGGIFTWFCQHGVCYGAYVIPTAEGRNEAYSFLTGYFAEAPQVVIYDFACNLQEYCLNRAPSFFQNTLFVIDKFHWQNHTSCSLGYCMTAYAHLANANSQLAE